MESHCSDVTGERLEKITFFYEVELFIVEVCFRQISYLIKISNNCWSCTRIQPLLKQATVYCGGHLQFLSHSLKKRTCLCVCLGTLSTNKAVIPHLLMAKWHLPLDTILKETALNINVILKQIIIIIII